MIREAIDRITDLAAPETYQINGDTYTTVNLQYVEPHIDRPASIEFSSLDGIVQAIQTEIGRDEITKPVFVSVEEHDKVVVFTTYRKDNLKRDYLYKARPDLPQPFPTWSKHEDAIIMLRSRFVQNEDTAYLLDLLSRISNDDSVTSEDNGVSQKVTATVGVALKGFENVKPRVKLAPFRTFLEVGQPESEFILRVKAGDKEHNVPPEIGIIEADGGAWKIDAKHNIAAFFRESLSELVEKGQVVIAE